MDAREETYLYLMDVGLTYLRNHLEGSMLSRLKSSYAYEVAQLLHYIPKLIGNGSDGSTKGQIHFVTEAKPAFLKAVDPQRDGLIQMICTALEELAVDDSTGTPKVMSIRRDDQ